MIFLLKQSGSFKKQYVLNVLNSFKIRKKKKPASFNFAGLLLFLAPKIQNMNDLLEDTKDLARIFDLYFSKANLSQNTSLLIS